MDSRSLSEVSDAELGDVLRGAVEAEAVAKAAQVAAIAELERRGTWRDDGMRVLSDWVALTTNVSAASARRVTATARRLADLSLVTKALAEGVLTWDQVVPLSRLAADDEGWLSYWGRCQGEDADRFESAMERIIERETTPLRGEGRIPYDERAAEAMAIVVSIGLGETPRLDRAGQGPCRLRHPHRDLRPAGAGIRCRLVLSGLRAAVL